MILKKSKYIVKNAEASNGGTVWTFTIDLGDTDHTLVNVPVVLLLPDLTLAHLLIILL